MGSVVHPVSLTATRSPLPRHSRPPKPSSTPRFSSARAPRSLRLRVRLCSNLSSSDKRIHGEEPSETLVEVLRVPDSWLIPSNALKESEWLRVTLHEWLDDEYCPEPTNVVISKLAARSYYESLTKGQSDLGEILLNMVKDLETISYQESFHGPFSSANAAVHLITQRMDSLVDSDS
ncbi:uncharacterized protein LOC120283588 [Dioscorea cayenensis subsp. rotundata]|uniref:Uncharacterized protein LOC120283588 n=1 Tax=Dioscorea cayennensis subsp. rotundata TaxID=55577 RepID=A0AB40D3K2_DIOCR|nr:uncharacterized protein LOC120283588 [Dioscorea cayenensis subsp. rotundata]